MSTAAPAPPKTASPAGYVLWHRPHVKGARWRKVFTTRDHATATAKIDAAGDWWVAVIADERLLPDSVEGAQPGLFDAG